MTITDPPPLPALVEGTLTHTRRTPIIHRFSSGIYQWLVDVDDPPQMPRWLRPFSTFSAADHLGDPDLSIRANLENFCQAQGHDIAGQRIIMLANARVLGHTFDPLSVFWVLAEDNRVTCVVAEVHNTYGERHGYVVVPDTAGRTRVDKAFYVSPFFTTEGHYDLHFKLGAGIVSSTVILQQAGQAVFSATFHGTPRPATARRLASLILKKPLMTHRISLAIRIHGVWLWLRRLPIVKRPRHQAQDGSQ